MKTLAIVGAGPMLGMSIAKAFGAHDYQVALIARRRESLDSMVAELKAGGIIARGFVADLTKEAELAHAFADVKAALGDVDVLEFSPLAMSFAPPSQATPELVQAGIDFLLKGGINAARQVLPSMRERGQGALLYSTGRSSILPMKLLGSLGPSSAGLRHYVYSLNEELRGTGIFVGTAVILARMERSTAEKVAALYLDMIEKRDRVEEIVGEGETADTARQIAALTQVAAPFELPKA
jgi:NAD(P)-dependent dehydrogenase (short-subunit alcohol dehydrogenase family)